MPDPLDFTFEDFEITLYSELDCLLSESQGDFIIILNVPFFYMKMGNNTLISLITVEVGINVEGRQKLPKRGGWNKCGGWKIFMNLINMEGGFFMWRVEFFKMTSCLLVN